jgi:hypothetical protein
VTALEAMAAEAAALADDAAREGLVLKAVGGIGIWHVLPSELRSTFASVRPVPGDLDMLAPAGTSNAIRQVFDARGYAADERLIAWHGKHRHRYHARLPSGLELDVDVFLGTPPSCHELDVVLDAASRVAVAPSDLLLQKLQIHELNTKDLIDLALLLVGAEIDDERVAAPLSDSWGFYHSATLNLDRVENLEANGLPAAVAVTAANRAAALRKAIEATPKTRRWRLRARVGTRVQWFTEVEELDR